MATIKYLDPETKEYKSLSMGGGGTSIPASDTEPATGNYWLDTSAEGGSYYTAGETLSSSTKTALGIAEDATPDVAFAEIGRQLSEPKGVQIELLWKNPSPNSSFTSSTVAISNIADYDGVIVEFKDNSGTVTSNVTSFVFSKNFQATAVGFNVYARIRMFSIASNGVYFGTAYKYENNRETEDNSQLVPVRIYGIKGVTSLV